LLLVAQPASISAANSGRQSFFNIVTVSFSMDFKPPQTARINEAGLSKLSVIIRAG